MTAAAAAEKAKEKMLTLFSSDNQEEFEVKESAAMQSAVFKYIIEAGFAVDGVPLSNITSHILAKVIEYCNRHAWEPTGAATAEPNMSAEDELNIFDASFVKVEPATLFDLNKAAQELGIKGLLDLTGQTIADMMGKTPKEIRKTFNINDLTISSTPALAAAMRSSERKQTAEERMTKIAEMGETDRKNGYQPAEPPLEIFKYPELLERAWGWDTILPHSYGESWSQYMNYLQEYYNRNAPAALVLGFPKDQSHEDAHAKRSHNYLANDADAAADLNLNGGDGSGLAALVNLCINKEGRLLDLLKCHANKFEVDEISLIDKLTSCAHQITNVGCGGFPAPTVALKCIMAEADLLCELLMHETINTSNVDTCCKIRKLAFRFMTYKGSECFAAAATMMATIKEAKLMCEYLRNKCLERSCMIRDRTLRAMSKIYRQCSVVEESMGGSTAAKSDDKNCSGKELVNEDNLLERNKINQNMKICSEELPKGNHLEERIKANQNTKDERYGKSGSEKETFGDNPEEVNGTKQMTKEEPVKGDNMKERSEKQKTKVEIQENCASTSNVFKEPLNGGNLNENEKQKTEENVVKQDSLQVDHKKHLTKLGDCSKTSSVEVTTSLSLSNKMDQGTRPRKHGCWRTGWFGRQKTKSGASIDV